MDEKHKKRGRRSHLNDFHLNVAGEYVYDGSVFVCRSSEESLRGSKRAASVVWALAKLGTDWREVREYNYEKSVAVLPVRTVVTAGFAALGIVCEGIFFFANKPADKALFALLYVLLKLIVLLCALGVRAKIMQAEWDKIPKKDKS